MSKSSSICWLDPGTDATRWETECGQYRIDLNLDSASYTPRRLVLEPVSSIVTNRYWIAVAPIQPSLDAAMQRINEYHCSAYNLIPY